MLRMAEYDLRRFVVNDQVRHCIIMRDHIIHIIGLCGVHYISSLTDSVQAQHRNNILILFNDTVRDCLHHCIDSSASVNGQLATIINVLSKLRADDVELSRLRLVCRAFNRIAKRSLVNRSRGWAILLTFLDEFGLPHVCHQVVRVLRRFPVTVLLRCHEDLCFSLRLACRDIITSHCLPGCCRNFELTTLGDDSYVIVSEQSSLSCFCGPTRPCNVVIQFGEAALSSISGLPSVLVSAT